MSKYHGFPSAVLENSHFRLEYLTNSGPRLVSLSYHGSPNLLADVHDIEWDTPNGKYQPLGGHRLWISPEVPGITYFPDRGGLEAQPVLNGVELVGSIETGAGVRKTLRVVLDPLSPIVRLLHTVKNEGAAPLTFAPWAISMFRLGGTVLMPQPAGNVDPHGLLPNRLLVLWPYSSLDDPRLHLRDDFILLHAKPALPPFKLGYANAVHWLAYWNDGLLFRKSFDLQPGANYPDGGCSSEVYCGDRFVELESLGPLVTLPPGGSTSLTETWEVSSGLDLPFIPSAIKSLLEKK